MSGEGQMQDKSWSVLLQPFHLAILMGIHRKDLQTWKGLKLTEERTSFN